MTAPAAVTLATGGSDHRVTRTIEALTKSLAQMRPDLRIAHAFLDSRRRSHVQVIDRLVSDGHDEIVVIPLELSRTQHVGEGVASAIADAGRRHRQLRIRSTEPLGIQPSFLPVLDERLRTALSQARVRELDGLVLAAPGSSDAVANAAVTRAARAWGSRHHLPTIAAYASTSPPAAGEAVRSLRRDGRRHIAVGSLFLTPGSFFDTAAELALEAGAVAVSEPLGSDAEIARAVLARYAVGAVELVPIPV